MKVLLSFILFFLIAAEIKAQVASSSLYITLSDIQSVQIVEITTHPKAVLSEKKSDNEGVSILNPSASQIRKFESQPGNTELESQKKNKGSQMDIPELLFRGVKSDMQMANLDPKINRVIPHVLYQIDPR